MFLTDVLIANQDNDQILHKTEIIRGLHALRHFWKHCEAKLWPVECLQSHKTAEARWKGGEEMLDGVQKFALALAEDDHLSQTKSTRFIQELDAHPARDTFNRAEILTVLCDDYLCAIVLPTLQSWMEVFHRIDWNRSQ